MLQQAARRRLARCPTREGRRTLADFVADRPERLFHVGRLDTDTEGLILLTNDGDFAQRLAHPSYELDKTYVAEVEGVVAKATVGGCSPVSRSTTGRSRSSAAQVVSRPRRPLDRRAGDPRGPQPIVRRLLDQVGHPVRGSPAPRSGRCRSAGWRRATLRELTRDELGALLDAAGL